MLFYMFPQPALDELTILQDSFRAECAVAYRIGGLWVPVLAVLQTIPISAGSDIEHAPSLPGPGETRTCPHSTRR